MNTEKCSSGVPGLDDILGGGWPSNSIYLVEGTPGVGKTTVAIQFLLEGKRLGERCLYVTLSETMRELTAVASSHCWDLTNIKIIELSAVERAINQGGNTLFKPAEVELTQLTKLLIDEIAGSRSTRIVLDSLSELRLLSQSPLPCTGYCNSASLRCDTAFCVARSASPSFAACISGKDSTIT